MDAGISRWILEFILRLPVNDTVINGLISVLPLFEDDEHLMKLLLLRRIFSEVSAGLISEKILESLEMIEEVDYREGVRILKSMKEAYGAVAVDCTVRFLRENPEDCSEYFDAVVRIWRGRIVEMERWGDVGLVSDQLRDLRGEIEAAVWSVDVRKNVLTKDTRNDALKSVRGFLVEAVEEMGPSFLEKMAKKVHEKGGVLQFPNVTLTANQIEARQVCLPDHLHNELDVNTENVLNNNNVALDVDSHVKFPHVASNKNNISLTPEVSKVQEALKSSSIELQAAVTDPLPDALRVAATISSNMVRQERNLENSGENQNATGVNPYNPSVDKVVDTVHTKEVDTENQNAVSRPSILLRNSTARTYEWDDDSVESSFDGSPKRPRLRTPTSRNLSPLIKQDIKRGFTRRRKKKKWSPLEEQTLRDAVKEYGRGNWKLILENYRDIFEERTVVDLKDKWRNMTR